MATKIPKVTLTGWGKYMAATFALGASIELFMVKTKFYYTVRRNTAEDMREERIAAKELLLTDPDALRRRAEVEAIVAERVQKILDGK